MGAKDWGQIMIPVQVWARFNVCAQDPGLGLGSGRGGVLRSRSKLGPGLGSRSRFKSRVPFVFRLRIQGLRCKFGPMLSVGV
ncbi:unnamed protein product [Ilex paraguariensis]|uniref:Uncharacterized protein n=1 Tax=Ilex paraguariensis TaxID=185542 RepID=A0ABC8TPV1_9AQUA